MLPEDKEKRNQLQIDYNRRYWMILVDNNFINQAWIETFKHDIVNGETFNDVIYSLINTSNFYSYGVDIEYRNDSLKKIPEQEKEIIEGLVKKLEKHAVKNKELMRSLESINKICKNSDFNPVNIM